MSAFLEVDQAQVDELMKLIPTLKSPQECVRFCVTLTWGLARSLSEGNKVLQESPDGELFELTLT